MDMNSVEGKIIVYYGKGEGKTSTSIGHAIRMLGHNKKGTPEDIEGTKELVSGQIDAGFTSFAIDASHLFNFQGGDLREELADNIDLHTKLINPNTC